MPSPRRTSCGSRPARSTSAPRKDEHVYVGAHDATFIGLAAEHEIGNDSHGDREIDGWYTVAWTRDGATWKVAHWTWQPYRSTLDFQRDYWNDNFRQDVGFSHEPNQLLVTTTAGITPGAALDLATGQGRNALYLASHGWTVTAVDISDEGLRRAHEAAARAHVALDTVQAGTGNPPVNDCAAAVIKKVKFPASNSATHVEYPFWLDAVR
jgi:SAM-dependent methyltransferase